MRSLDQSDVLAFHDVTFPAVVDRKGLAVPVVAHDTTFPNFDVQSAPMLFSVNEGACSDHSKMGQHKVFAEHFRVRRNKIQAGVRQTDSKIDLYPANLTPQLGRQPPSVKQATGDAHDGTAISIREEILSQRVVGGGFLLDSGMFSVFLKAPRSMRSPAMGAVTS